MNKKQQVIAALRAHIAQRSGIDWRNYGGSREAYMADYRPMLRHGKQARAMLAWIEPRDSITAENIVDGVNHAYGGRLTISERPDGAVAVDYCAGQYFATEYRAAACAGLSAVIWAWLRDQCGCDTSGKIRAAARRELGRGIAREWFL